MRIFVFGLILALAGCQSYFDDQQRQVDERNAQRDHLWCEDIGIAKADPRYPDCRIVAADLRQRGKAQADAKALGLLGIGAGAASQGTDTTRCQTVGTATTCQTQ